MSEPRRTVADTVRRAQATLSPAERRVAGALLAAYPTAGLETVARLAARAEVSGPTVIRFVTRLGFAGYPEFQQALRDDIDARGASPLRLYERAPRAGAAEGGLLAEAATTLPDAVARTFAAVSPEDLERAVSLVAGARRVLVAGGRYSGLVARYLHQHLEQLRPDAVHVPPGGSARAAATAGVSRRDVLVVFDFRRYEPASLSLARLVRAARGTVVLVTDAYVSPVAVEADVVLACDVSSVSPYDSMAPAMALAETLVAGVLRELGPAAEARMRLVEDTAERLDLY